MQQVKLFCGVEDRVSDLETEVNTWIRDNKFSSHMWALARKGGP